MFLKPVLENGEMGNGKMKWEIEIANSFFTFYVHKNNQPYLV